MVLRHSSCHRLLNRLVKIAPTAVHISLEVGAMLAVLRSADLSQLRRLTWIAASSECRGY